MPLGRKGRPTREEVTKYGRGGLKGHMARLEKEREKLGKVAAFLWQGRLYCTVECILSANGMVWSDSPEGKQILRLRQLHRKDKENLFLEIELDEKGLEDLDIQRRGRWNLARYTVVRFHAQDVAHFRCPGCKRPLRVPLPKKQLQKLRESFKEWKRQRDKAYRDGLKARKAADKLEQEQWWAEHRAQLEARWNVNLKPFTPMTPEERAERDREWRLVEEAHQRWLAEWETDQAERQEQEARERAAAPPCPACTDGKLRLTLLDALKCDRCGFFADEGQDTERRDRDAWLRSLTKEKEKD